MSVPSGQPPPPYDESGEWYPSSHFPGKQVYPGVQSTGSTTQPGLQYDTQNPPELQQGTSPFHQHGQPKEEPNGQPQFYPQYQPGYPQPLLYPGGPYPPGSYRGQQPYGHPIPGQPCITTQVVVTKPVQQPGYVVTTSRPPDYLIPAILVCFCCFCPTGFAAICYAHEANRMTISGNIDGANRSSNAARVLIIASVVVGIIIIIVTTVLRSGVIY
ncbi:hypothetical protein DPMN_108157 [Dreissena polymorpha]|uniref:Uncharacterized protein n=1 Tax=Dreissena polymorpha TaxID=45954 RepID=A0A9D4QKW6_DREPO|nr:hypothetical protein DPMN_108157 [Dreissena polymorpha]